MSQANGSGDVEERGYLNRKETITRLCQLAGKVREAKFPQQAADCFCNDSFFRRVGSWSDFRFDSEVMRFIEEAVNEKLMSEGKTI